MFEKLNEKIESSKKDNKEFKPVNIIKDYSGGKWKKIFSAIADMGVAGTSATLGLAVFGLSVWGGPVGIGAVLAGLGSFLMVGTPGLVLKIIFKLGDDYLRVNPKIKKLAELAKKDGKAMSIAKSIEKELDTGKADKGKLRGLKKEFANRLKELEKKNNITESAFNENETEIFLKNINESALLNEAFKLNFREVNKDQFKRFMYVKDKVSSDDKYKYIKLSAGTLSVEKLKKLIKKISNSLDNNADKLDKLNDYQRLDLLMMLLDKAKGSNNLKLLEEKTKKIYHKYMDKLNLDNKETKIQFYSEKLGIGESLLAFLIFSAIIILIPGIHFELGTFLVASQAVLIFLTNIPAIIRSIIERFTINKKEIDKKYDIDNAEFNSKLQKVKERLSESIDFDKEFLLENIFNK
jgi:hypothetical protein